MKLSEAQKEIIERAHNKIDYARTHTLIEWATNCLGYSGKDLEDYQISRVESYANNYRKYYEQERKAIVLCRANSRTIKKLEEIGLVEILKVGGSFPDTIKILNY